MTYSFRNVNVFLTIQANISLGPIPIGVPINITGKGFYGKDGSITVNPNPDAIKGEDVSIDGVMLADISNDLSGNMVVRVGDLTPAHYLFMTLYNFQQQGILVRDIGINILQKPIGQSEDLLSASLLYSGSSGLIRGLPSKSWGATQNGNEFTFKFEKISAVTTISLLGDIFSQV